MHEGIAINKGLFVLGNVINALANGASHVPYQESTLTKVLKDSLGGNSYTLMVACISSAEESTATNLNTLRYAQRAKKLVNRPQQNVTIVDVVVPEEGVEQEVLEEVVEQEVPEEEVQQEGIEQRRGAVPATERLVVKLFEELSAKVAVLQKDKKDLQQKLAMALEQSKTYKEHWAQQKLKREQEAQLHKIEKKVSYNLNFF